MSRIPQEVLDLYAGKIVHEMQPNGGWSVSARTAPGGRVCGGCSACCKLLPVPELNKPGGQRCKHQRAGKGCAIYRQAGFPESCHVWSCRWLSDPETAGMPRPDRCHYVIDIAPDVIRAEANGQVHHVNCLQVWIDPGFPEAHRAPELRAYLAKVGEKYRMAAIIRWADSADGMLLFPPAMMPDGQWYEIRQPAIPREAFNAQVTADLRTPPPHQKD